MPKGYYGQLGPAVPARKKEAEYSLSYSSRDKSRRR